MNNLSNEEKELITQKLYAILSYISHILNYDCLNDVDISVSVFVYVKYQLDNCLEIIEKKNGDKK